MTQFMPAMKRRAALLGLGFGIPTSALAATPKKTATPEIRSAEFWAQKGDVKLYMFRKFAANGDRQKPILFLSHGSSGSGRSGFDLSVPGHGDYSMMNAFARFGFDCWTMDHENHGRSSRTAGNSDVASGAADIAAAMAVVARETGQQKVHLFGMSAGSLRAGVYAMANPDRVDRLVLAAFTYTGEGAPTLIERRKQVEAYRASNRRKRGRDAILSIFTRDMPGTSDPAVGEAMADAELQFGDEVPTGTYLDMSVNLPLVHPDKLQGPVMLIRGEHDGIATMADLTTFYAQLKHGDRQFVVLPNTSHGVTLGYTREQLWHAVHAFLTMPPVRRI